MIHRSPTAKGLAALAMGATGLFAAPALALQDTGIGPETFEITGYRIESNDCPITGCGFLADGSAESIADYLAAASSARLAAASSPHRSHLPFGFFRGLRRFKAMQTVVLDFETGPEGTFLVDFAGTPTLFNAHVFTPEERMAVRRRLERDYAAFNVRFTEQPPPSGDFTTLTFRCLAEPCITVTPTGGVSILFGRADNIDFLNSDQADNAFADVSFWEFLTQFDPTGGIFSAFTTLPVDADNPLAQQLSVAIVNQGSNTGGHEVGHIMGLRHHDSFGAPGDGLPTTGVPDPSQFVPIFDGPQDAAETTLHLMASGASAGLSLAGSAASDRFFSERSAIKLISIERGNIVSEARARGNNGIVELRRLRTPNTILEGENADRRLDVRSTIVEGRIDVREEVDSYGFRGIAGRFLNIEMVSFSDINVADPVIGALKLYFRESDGTLTPVAENIQTFEPFDPLLFDVELPFTGTYVLEVTAPNIVFINGQPFPLDETDNGELRTGDYELLAYTVDSRLGRDRYRKLLLSHLMK